MFIHHRMLDKNYETAILRIGTIICIHHPLWVVMVIRIFIFSERCNRQKVLLYLLFCVVGFFAALSCFPVSLCLFPQLPTFQFVSDSTLSLPDASISICVIQPAGCKQYNCNHQVGFHQKYTTVSHRHTYPYRLPVAI